MRLEPEVRRVSQVDLDSPIHDGYRDGFRFGDRPPGRADAVIASLKIFAVLAVALYGVLCLAMFALQSSLLYHPSRDPGPPADYGLGDFRRVTFPTSDGLTITGWLRHPGANGKAVVYFYGNADSLAGSPSLLRDLADAGYTVLGVNYRGYGGSEGSPAEAGLYRDGEAALEFLKSFVAVENVILLGRSLGTGVAVELASRHPLKGLALVSPYTSIPDVAAEAYWFLPVRLLARERFSSIDKIGRATAPLLIIHGDEDTLIPQRLGRALYDAAAGPKRFEVFAGQDHNMLDLKRIAASVIAFADGL